MATTGSGSSRRRRAPWRRFLMCRRPGQGGLRRIALTDRDLWRSFFGNEASVVPGKTDYRSAGLGLQRGLQPLQAGGVAQFGGGVGRPGIHVEVDWRAEACELFAECGGRRFSMSKRRLASPRRGPFSRWRWDGGITVRGGELCRECHPTFCRQRMCCYVVGES